MGLEAPGERLPRILKALNKAGLPDFVFKWSDGQSSAYRGLMQSRTRICGPEPHEMRAEAAATKEQRLVGRAFCQRLEGQIVARKVGQGRKGSSCSELACQHLGEL